MVVVQAKPTPGQLLGGDLRLLHIARRPDHPFLVPPASRRRPTGPSLKWVPWPGGRREDLRRDFLMLPCAAYPQSIRRKSQRGRLTHQDIRLIYIYAYIWLDILREAA